MIIKIACTCDEASWRYYEGDRVQSTFNSYEGWLKEWGGDIELINGPGIHEDYLVSDRCAADTDPPTTISLISFVSKDGTENNIYTDRKVYLMTEQGDTIERLN